MRYLSYLFLLFSTCLCADELRTCLDYEPIVVDDTGESHWAGRNIEILHHISGELGFTLDTSVRAPFARCLKLLENGDIDVIPGLAYSKEREAYMELIPYGDRHTLAIFYNVDQPVTKPLESLTSRERIGIHTEFKLPDSLEGASWLRNLVRVNSTLNGLQLVAKKRLTGVLATIDTGWEIIRENPDLMDQITYKAIAEKDNEPVFLGVSKKIDRPGLVAKIEAAIKALSEQESLNHLQISVH